MPHTANRLRMGNDPADCRELCLQAIFNLVHRRMHIINCLRRREAAMIVNEQALVILPNADVVKVAQARLFLGQRLEQADDGI